MIIAWSLSFDESNGWSKWLKKNRVDAILFAYGDVIDPSYRVIFYRYNMSKAIC